MWYWYANSLTMDTHTREGYKSSKYHTAQMRQNGYQSIPEKRIMEIINSTCDKYETYHKKKIYIYIYEYM